MGVAAGHAGLTPGELRRNGLLAINLLVSLCLPWSGTPRLPAPELQRPAAWPAATRP